MIKINNYKRLLIGISCFIFLTGCGFQSENTNQLKPMYSIAEENKDSKSNPIQTIIKKLEGENKGEENFLFYNEADESKMVTLTFYENYNEEPIINATLYQDGNLVSNNVRIIDTSIHDGGLFTIELEEYIPTFNQIKLETSQGNILLIKTGQYSFEKVNIKNTITDSERWYIESYNTGEKGTYFTFNGTYVRAKEGSSKYEILLPKSSEKFEIVEDHTQKEKEKKLELTLKSDSQRKFDHQASYEIMIIQKNEQNQQYVMNTISVDIEPN
ncbi:hypothetical protein V1503_05155 [Bacillus sp. SCS-151]|uniref:hypothetical protein n=1 Tax=Nanhaiella sioensis TaxID=3115293 RepID=UPI003978B128